MNEVVSSQLLRDWPLPDVDDGAGKAARGTVVVIGGAVDTPGAVLLAGLAALRVGAGRLTMATVAPLPATATGALGADAVGQCVELVDGADAIVLGPGMRGLDDARSLVHG